MSRSGFGGTIEAKDNFCVVEKGKNISTKHEQADSNTEAQSQYDEAVPKPKLTKAQGERMSQSAKAMTYSVLATLAIVVAFMALTPESEREFDPGVDVAAAETEVASVAAFTPATIDAPETWRANYARWHSGTQDEIPAWTVGYLTEHDEFFGIAQTSNATPAWIDDTVNPVGEATETTVANQTVDRWVGEDEHIYYVAEFDQPPVEASEVAVEPSDTMTLIVSGSMEEDRFRELAAEVIGDYR